MLTEGEVAQLQEGQSLMVVSDSPRATHRPVVQIIPIRSRISGRVLRYLVRLAAGRRGTVGASVPTE